MSKKTLTGLTQNPIEMATDVAVDALSAFDNNEYNEDVFETINEFNDRDAKERASRSGSNSSAVPSGYEVGCEAFPDTDTGGELNPITPTRSSSLGNSDAPKTKHPLEGKMTNATQAQAQAGGVGAFPMAIASRPSEQQPSVAASVPINMRMPTTSRPRLGSRPNPPTDQSTAGRLDEADEVETDDERDDGPLNAGAGPASSGRPRRREEQRRLRKKAREEASSTLTEHSQAATESEIPAVMVAHSMRDRAAYYGVGVGERPDSSSTARIFGGRYGLQQQQVAGSGGNAGNNGDQ